MQTSDVTLDTPDGPMRAYEAYLEGRQDERAPTAVIVIQEAFGVNDHIEDVTRRAAGEGVHAIAPALFHRSGGGTAPYDDFSKVLPMFEGLTDDGILMDVDAAIEHLHSLGYEDRSIGIVGFCMGGRVSFLVATERTLGAAVGFYGGGIVTGRFPQFPPLIDRSAELKTPWLGLFGDADDGIPIEDVEQLRATLDDVAPVEHDIVRYPSAEHGFNCDRRPSYHPEAAADAWQRTLDWFRTHLKP
jgi:carboxymethylenebutenolidase